MATHKPQKTPGFDLLLAFITAVRFLTIVPVPWHSDADQEYFAKSLVFFPLVAVLIGAGGWLVAMICTSVFPGPVTAFILLVYLSVISGFLHLDGLADSADGLLSHRPAAQALEIMRDSRVGAMAVIVLLFLLLGKYSALISIPGSNLPAVMMVTPVAGRAAILLLMAFFPWARKEGLGQLFASRHTLGTAMAAFFLLAVLGMVLVSFLAAIMLVLVTGVVAISFGFYCTRRFGGVSGDILGAVCEGTELLVMLAFSAAFTLL